MAFLELHGISKSFDRPVLREIDLGLERGQILALLGPSGCGKTTLMRLVAGLEEPDAGRIVFQGREITHLAPQKRNFGLMFQEFALFPNRTVAGNVAFGLRSQKLPEERVARRTREVLELMGIASLAGRGVESLSGGERQRVALARSLAPRPELLMLDEPMGALDRLLRERLLPEVREILKKLGMTSIFVTHDQAEALAVADRIAVMNRGGLVRTGEPRELYLWPGTEFVARFMGFKNLLPGRMAPGGGVETALGLLHPGKPGPPGAGPAEPGQEVVLVLRPEAARPLESGCGPGEGPVLRGKVLDRLFLGRYYRVSLTGPGATPLVFDLEAEGSPPGPGEDFEFTLNPAAMAVVEPEARDEE